jgi:hypothetical protein
MDRFLYFFILNIEGDETDFLTLNTFQHRLHMELDRQSLFVTYGMELNLQSVFGLHMHGCTHMAMRPRNPPPPRIWAHLPGGYW